MRDLEKQKKKSVPVATRAAVSNRGPFPERMQVAGGGKGLVDSAHGKRGRRAKSGSTNKK